MKVYIGPYRSWIGPYQIAEWLRFVGVSENRRHKIGKYLASTWLDGFCQWIHSHKKITRKIRIDEYDVWGMDGTLALIILPMLKMLKERKHGSCMVDDDDVPENLRSTSAPPRENEWDTDDFVHDRWDYVLDEMIWAFEHVHPDFEESEASVEAMFDKTIQTRIDNGLRLFGKYYRGLWD